MTVIQCATDLSSKLSSSPFAKAAMRNDVIEHLTTVDEFEHHVMVIRVCYEFPHSADIRVMQEKGDGGFSDGTDFLRFVLLA